jgi:hypothetical protein
MKFILSHQHLFPIEMSIFYVVYISHILLSEIMIIGFFLKQPIKLAIIIGNISCRSSHEVVKLAMDSFLDACMQVLTMTHVYVCR